MNEFTIFFANHTTGEVIVKQVIRKTARTARAGALRHLLYWERLSPGDRFVLVVLPGLLPLGWLSFVLNEYPIEVA